MAKKKKDDDAKPEAAPSDGSIAVNDAWTGMLAVSLLALVIGSGFLFYDYYQYSDEIPKSPKFTLTTPGPGPGKPKVEPKVEPPGGDKGKDADKKDPEKKDKDA